MCFFFVFLWLNASCQDVQYTEKICSHEYFCSPCQYALRFDIIKIVFKGEFEMWNEFKKKTKPKCDTSNLSVNNFPGDFFL